MVPNSFSAIKNGLHTNQSTVKNCFDNSSFKWLMTSSMQYLPWLLIQREREDVYVLYMYLCDGKIERILIHYFSSFSVISPLV